MKMETSVRAPDWRRMTVYYRLLEDMNHFGFSIEAVGCLPESPHLWIEGSSVVLHHSPGLFIVLAHMPERLLQEISSRKELTISESYQRHYSDGLAPWGLDRVGSGGPQYVVPILHIEKIGDLRQIFNALPDAGRETSLSPTSRTSPIAE